MAERPAGFTEPTARRILTDIADLKRRPVPRGNFAHDMPFTPGMITTRWARTCVTDDYPTYPSSGNVVGIEFGDYAFSPWYPGATATETFTPWESGEKTFAYCESETIPAVSTVVRVTWRNGTWCVFEESGTLAYGGSTSGNYGWRDGDGGETDGPIIGYNGSDTKTVKVFPTLSVSGNFLASVVTWEDSPAAYSDNWLAMVVACKLRITVRFEWALPSLSLSDAQTYIRASQHRHLQSGGASYTDYETPDALALSSMQVGITGSIDVSSGTDATTYTTMPLHYTLAGWDTKAFMMADRVYSLAAGDTVNITLERTVGDNIARPYMEDCTAVVQQLG